MLSESLLNLLDLSSFFQSELQLELHHCVAAFELERLKHGIVEYFHFENYSDKFSYRPDKLECLSDFTHNFFMNFLIKTFLAFRILLHLNEIHSASNFYINHLLIQYFGKSK